MKHDVVFIKFVLCLRRARKPIGPEHRLVMTLRFLCTGAPYRTILQWDFCVPHNTLSLIIREVCNAIIAEFRDDLKMLPRDPKAWREVADGFSTRWNFEHCLGAIDGKHIAIKKPKGSGSTHYNYKGFCSIVLLAIVDSQYRFMWINVGSPGRCSDGGIWKDSTLHRRVEGGRQGIPAPEPLPGHRTPVPWFFVGDAAFALAPWMQKPFPHRGRTRQERIYNYRHSRARRIVENGFGLLVVHWRCLTTPLGLAPENARTVTTACVCLHNIIRNRRAPPQEARAARRAHHQLRSNRNMDGGRTNTQSQEYKAAKAARDYLRDYYFSPDGAVHWQDRVTNVRRPSSSESSSSSSEPDED